MRVARAVLICIFAFAGLVNAQTSLQIQSIQANPDGSITITWPVVPTWTYHVMYADVVDGSWQDFPDGQLTAGTNDSVLCYTDTSTVGVPQRFYKIRRPLAQLVMTLVLDRSGSMNPIIGTTRGGAYLPGAVSDFIGLFGETNNSVAMVSFASTVTTDVPMTNLFQTAITTAASNLLYYGGTFSPGGLTNALVQNNNAAVPPGQNALNVVVFFTDGRANMIQQTLSCGQIFNFGGYDMPDSGAGFFQTNAPVTETGQEDVRCSAPEDGQMSGPMCNGCSANSYNSPLQGPGALFSTDGITADSEFECEQIANQMRAQGMYVFCAGLGGAPIEPVNLTFLQQVANDPNSPTFNPNQPVGQAVIANDPTALDAVFQQIASEIQTHQ